MWRDSCSQSQRGSHMFVADGFVGAVTIGQCSSHSSNAVQTPTGETPSFEFASKKHHRRIRHRRMPVEIGPRQSSVQDTLPFEGHVPDLTNPIVNDCRAFAVLATE